MFASFDGKPYDREAIEEEFRRISPRVSLVAKELIGTVTLRDLSKYRDEISAYPAYLGLYRMEWENNSWVLRISETAKRFLIGEEPNVPAFMTIQLAMFQYPNGIGASYTSKAVHVKPNARDRTLEIVSSGIRISPFRLICKALLADSQINGINSLHPNISIRELSLLINDERINKAISPSISNVVAVLKEIRAGQKRAIKGFESRFHLLNHTDLLQSTNGYIHLRESFSPHDSARIIKLLNLIGNLDLEFNGFDNLTSGGELNNIVKTGNWSRYFDGVVQLSSEIVNEISGEDIANSLQPITAFNDSDETIPDNSDLVFKYPLRERGSDESEIGRDYKVKKQSDPEVTRIKRQKSNLMHKILMSQLDEYLRLLGATPMENEHIDLFATLPNKNSFLFEIKSTSSENLLSQTRKGLSQLYEYRYRYSDEIGKEVNLCLVYPKEPKEIEWLQDYLCNDRDIAVAWFEGNDFHFSFFCQQKLQNLILK